MLEFLWHAASAPEPLILNARVQPPLTNLSDLQSCVNMMSSNLFSKITLFILMPSRGGAFERTADTPLVLGSPGMLLRDQPSDQSRL